MGGVALLESAGPVTPYGRASYLSAAPTRTRHDLPERPRASGVFPAWIGGLKYEASAAFHLPAHATDGSAQAWGYYPSGLVWDHEAGTLDVVGERHLDWEAVLAAAPVPPPPCEVGAWGADDLDFVAGVRDVQELIRAGEVYQVNLSRGVRARATGDPLGAYLRLAALNPSPFMAFLELPAETVVSCSPERLVLWNGDHVSARPIAGTRRRGATREEDDALEAELRESAKEQAEHVMLVDLVRHDVGRASAPGSVWVPDLMLVERYSHVMHLVSEVTGRSRADLTVRELVQATFPGGTITGAPKRRVMQAIRDLEPEPRGWYTGSVGIVSGERVDLNILIRTAAFHAGHSGVWEVRVRAGAGVVIDSDPHAEAEETRHKAAALLQSLGAAEPRAAQTPEPPRAGRPWRPQPVRAVTAAPRVLLLDNFDSFTFNLVHDLLALGAHVTVRDNTANLDALLDEDVTHVLVGPGPGTPATSGVTLDLVRACLREQVPLLGVCLGHQALGEALGGRVDRAGQAVHGKPEFVRHSGEGLFDGIDAHAAFTRYHSLVLRGVPAALRVTATSADGEVMAVEATGAPAWGVQFHPESVLSEAGRTLLANWLRLGAAHRSEARR